MANETEAALRGLRKRDLIRFLETDKRVRDWLSGGDPMDQESGALVSTKQAAEMLGIERPRVWRWEQAGRLTRVDTNNATPLFYRHEVLALKAEEERKAAERERRAQEAAAAADG